MHHTGIEGVARPDARQRRLPLRDTAPAALPALLRRRFIRNPANVGRPVDRLDQRLHHSSQIAVVLACRLHRLARPLTARLHTLHRNRSATLPILFRFCGLRRTRANLGRLHGLVPPLPHDPRHNIQMRLASLPGFLLALPVPLLQSPFKHIMAGPVSGIVLNVRLHLFEAPRLRHHAQQQRRNEHSTNEHHRPPSAAPAQIAGPSSRTERRRSRPSSDTHSSGAAGSL